MNLSSLVYYKIQYQQDTYSKTHKHQTKPLPKFLACVSDTYSKHTSTRLIIILPHIFKGLTPIQKHTSTRHSIVASHIASCLTPIQKHTSTRLASVVAFMFSRLTPIQNTQAPDNFVNDCALQPV